MAVPQKRNRRGSPVGSTGVQNRRRQRTRRTKTLRLRTVVVGMASRSRLHPHSLVRLDSLPSRPVAAFVGIQQPTPNRARRVGRRRCLAVECDSDGRVRVAHEHPETHQGAHQNAHRSRWDA